MSRKITDQNLINEIVVAILSIPGVGSLVNAPIKYSLTSKELSKGINLTNNNNNQSLDIFITVIMQAKIPQVAFTIQENVKALLDKNSITLNKINIQIQGIEKWKDQTQEN